MPALAVMNSNQAAFLVILLEVVHLYGSGRGWVHSVFDENQGRLLITGVSTVMKEGGCVYGISLSLLNWIF